MMVELTTSVIVESNVVVYEEVMVSCEVMVSVHVVVWVNVFQSVIVVGLNMVVVQVVVMVGPGYHFVVVSFLHVVLSLPPPPRISNSCSSGAVVGVIANVSAV